MLGGDRYIRTYQRVEALRDFAVPAALERFGNLASHDMERVIDHVICAFSGRYPGMG